MWPHLGDFVPKHHLEAAYKASVGTKTFKIWKIGNYKSDVNETYIIYVPP